MAKTNFSAWARRKAADRFSTGLSWNSTPIAARKLSSDTPLMCCRSMRTVPWSGSQSRCNSAMAVTLPAPVAPTSLPSRRSEGNLVQDLRILELGEAHCIEHHRTRAEPQCRRVGDLRHPLGGLEHRKKAARL